MILIRHAWRVRQAGQVRFRLETFGLWWPALPYTAPWWRIPPRNLRLFMRQTRAYCHWVIEMERLRSDGPEVWWRRYRETYGENA